jgi:uncharacterized protein
MYPKSPFHEGELLAQKQAGEEVVARRNGQMIANMLTTGMAEFIKQQNIVILSSVDHEQNVWASILFGLAGFVGAINPQMIEFDLAKVSINTDDIFWTNILTVKQVGILLIEFVSRRRLRIGGAISWVEGDVLQLSIQECYPNCPKYIQRRQFFHSATASNKKCSEVRSGHFLAPEHQRWIKSSDTFFVASAHPNRGADASHRGGNPGFVQVLNEQSIRIPDYSGNSIFNTLGNLVVNSRAGLLFVDFDCGRTLQLTGRVTINWHFSEPKDLTGGTHRCWDFIIDKWVETDLPQPPKWSFLDFSPHNQNVLS